MPDDDDLVTIATPRFVLILFLSPRVQSTGSGFCFDQQPPALTLRASRNPLGDFKELMSASADEDIMKSRLLAKEVVLKRCLKKYCALRSAVKRQDVAEW